MKEGKFEYLRHVTHNRGEVERSVKCGCACCCAVFEAGEVADYTDGGTTAICPYCFTDAVIGDACGVELGEEWLEGLRREWF